MTDARPQPPKPRFRLGAAIAVAIAVAFVAWLLLRDGDDSDPQGAKPKAATIAELEQLPGEVGHSVYWAGPRAGNTYELTQTESGRIFIRYLPEGVEVGDDRPSYLSIATYPYKDAYDTLVELSRRKGSLSRKLDDGGIAVSSPKRPESVYIAYPDENLQVEVYDPSVEKARDLAFSGRVRPIE
jgi:hypothetical protein